MSTKFHQNLGRSYDGTSMLFTEVKRCISWAKLKIWPKIFNSLSWMWKWSWACPVTKNHVLIQNQVKFMSFDWQVECKWGWVCWSHGESNEEKLKLDEIFFELKWRSEWKDEKRSYLSVMESLFIQSFGFRWNFSLRGC